TTTSPRICRSRCCPSSSWSSISAPRSLSASSFRKRCASAPTTSSCEQRRRLSHGKTSSNHRLRHSWFRKVDSGASRGRALGSGQLCVGDVRGGAGRRRAHSLGRPEQGGDRACLLGN